MAFSVSLPSHVRYRELPPGEIDAAQNLVVPLPVAKAADHSVKVVHSVPRTPQVAQEHGQQRLPLSFVPPGNGGQNLWQEDA